MRQFRRAFLDPEISQSMLFKHALAYETDFDDITRQEAMRVDGMRRLENIADEEIMFLVNEPSAVIKYVSPHFNTHPQILRDFIFPDKKVIDGYTIGLASILCMADEHSEFPDTASEYRVSLQTVELGFDSGLSAERQVLAQPSGAMVVGMLDIAGFPIEQTQTYLGMTVAAMMGARLAFTIEAAHDALTAMHDAIDSIGEGQ